MGALPAPERTGHKIHLPPAQPVRIEGLNSLFPTEFPLPELLLYPQALPSGLGQDDAPPLPTPVPALSSRSGQKAPKPSACPGRCDPWGFLPCGYGEVRHLLVLKKMSDEEDCWLFLSKLSSDWKTICSPFNTSLSLRLFVVHPGVLSDPVLGECPEGS